jgi:hypothetical protein
MRRPIVGPDHQKKKEDQHGDVYKSFVYQHRLLYASFLHPYTYAYMCMYIYIYISIKTYSVGPREGFRFGEDGNQNHDQPHC